MASKFYIKQNDTRPAIVVQLLENSVAAPLTGAAVTFHMNGESLGSATIIDASEATARYQWVTGDTSTVGELNAEFQVVFSDGRIETFPNHEYLIIVIQKQEA